MDAVVGARVGGRCGSTALLIDAAKRWVGRTVLRCGASGDAADLRHWRVDSVDAYLQHMSGARARFTVGQRTSTLHATFRRRRRLTNDLWASTFTRGRHRKREKLLLFAAAFCPVWGAELTGAAPFGHVLHWPGSSKLQSGVRNSLNGNCEVAGLARLPQIC